MTTKSCRRVKSQMTQNVLLVWLDDKSEDYQNTVTQSRRVIHIIHRFTNSDECIAFFKDEETDFNCPKPYEISLIC